MFTRNTILNYLLISTISLLSTLVINGQDDVQEIYYKNIYQIKPVENIKKAKFVKKISSYGDSLKKIQFVRLSDNQVFKDICYKHNIPYGTWKLYNQNNKSYREFDYSFLIKHSKDVPKNIILIDLEDQKIVDGINPSDDFEFPKFEENKNISSHIYKSVWYPEMARNNGIEGTIKVLVKINTDGKINVISIFKGVESHLNAEAIRAIKTVKNITPATLNGEKIEVYSYINVVFRLE